MGHGNLTRPVRYIAGEEFKLPGVMVCPPKCYAVRHGKTAAEGNKGSISMTAHGAALGF